MPGVAGEKDRHVVVIVGNRAAVGIDEFLQNVRIVRFDLIYLMLDKQSEAMDRRLANHIVSLYGTDDSFLVLERQGVSREFLAEYITFARKYVFPRMKEDVADALVDSYQSMRRIGNS